MPVRRPRAAPAPISARIRSPRTVQQMQPLFISTICSLPVLHQDFIVDVFGAELVFDDGDLVAVLLLQDAVEQRGFAGAEEAGQDGGGNQMPWRLGWLVITGRNRRTSP